MAMNSNTSKQTDLSAEQMSVPLKGKKKIHFGSLEWPLNVVIINTGWEITWTPTLDLIWLGVFPPVWDMARDQGSTIWLATSMQTALVTLNMWQWDNKP